MLALKRYRGKWRAELSQFSQRLVSLSLEQCMYGEWGGKGWEQGREGVASWVARQAQSLEAHYRHFAPQAAGSGGAERARGFF